MFIMFLVLRNFWCSQLLVLLCSWCFRALMLLCCVLGARHAIGVMVLLMLMWT